MSAQRHEAEQFTMPLPVVMAKPTIGQMRDERDAMIDRLLVLAGHRNQVVRVSREQLERVAYVAVTGGDQRELFECFLAREPAVAAIRHLPSRRWRKRLHALRRLGERIVLAELEAAPHARRVSELPPPKHPAARWQAA